MFKIILSYYRCSSVFCVLSVTFRPCLHQAQFERQRRPVSMSSWCRGDEKSSSSAETPSEWAATRSLKNSALEYLAVHCFQKSNIWTLVKRCLASTNQKLSFGGIDDVSCGWSVKPTKRKSSLWPFVLLLDIFLICLETNVFFWEKVLGPRFFFLSFFFVLVKPFASFFSCLFKENLPME